MVSLKGQRAENFVSDHTCNNLAKRSMFVKNVVEYLLENSFDGMEFDWEYPVCWQMDCSIGNPNDKENFSQLIRELGQAFKQRGLILSVAVSSSSQVINRCDHCIAFFLT